MSHRVVIDRDELERLYVTQGLTIKETASALATSYRSVHRRLVEFSIPRRKRGGGVVTTQGRFPRTPEYLQKLRIASTGKVFTEERKLKISMANRGKKRTDEQKNTLSIAHMGFGGARAFWYGKHRSSETKAKIRAKLSGNKHPNWRGGLFSRKYSSEFNKELKELIRQRDNYTCQLCGVSQQECIRPLAVHHIDYDKYNPLPSNLISLCLACNSKVNFNRESWQQTFQKHCEKQGVRA